MPILGADMTAGTLIAWRKRPGDPVQRGEIIAEVETDKGLIDIEVFATGVLERILVDPGQTVPTGTVLAILREEAPTATAPAGPVVTPVAVVPAPGAALVSTAIPGTPAVPAGPTGERVRISPAARKLAAELGLDPATVRGTGPGGVIDREDIERAAARPVAVGRPRVDMARMRRIIGAAMARSKREIPHYYLTHTIDMARALDWLREQNLQRPVTERLLYGVLLVKAVALALGEVPELNAVWRGEEVVPSEGIHVGVAIFLRGGGLVAPALHDAHRRSVDDLMRGFRDLVQRARTGGLRSSELSDPTITVTSLGEQGVESVHGIVYPPQVAIVGFGKVIERPWVVEGAIVARPLVTATLSADHRVSDGHRGGLFLAAVDRRLQEPERL
jgi:pyruvate dehydrogenase E2 component (dihydrolipoamide acetyltransferase)